MPPPEVVAEMRKRIAEDAAHGRRFGHVRPPITVKHQGHRLVAVGSRVYFDQNWNTFVDFLVFYLEDVMSREWWIEQSARPTPEQHPLIHWHAHMVKLSAALPREPNGLIFAAPDGLMSAYLLLAYDLYVLRNNGKLQSEVVQRLRHRDQFHGARYELFVAATFTRAGLQFEYDDETDGSRKHPEFVATDAAGLAMAVEAKARQRPLGSAEDLVTIRPAVRDLLLNAAKKLEEDPMVVFLEVNLPPHADLLVWGNHLDEVVKDITSEKGQCPFALVMFTNRPHLYGEFGMPDPTKQWVFFRPHTSPVSLELTGTLTTAVTQYGNIPDQFPDEFGSAPS
jgi:hypothetical protein